MINMQVKFNKKSFNKRNNIESVIKTLLQINKITKNKITYVCADTLNNCLWVCCSNHEYQILLD